MSAVFAATLAQALSACVFSGEGDPTPVPDLGGRAYLFTGTGAGQTVEGSLEFLDEGGAIQSTYGTCHRAGERWKRWERRQRGSPALRFSCDDLTLDVDLVEGDLRNITIVTIPITEMREERVRCLAYSEDTGACVRWDTRTTAAKVRRSGSVRLTLY